MITLTDPNYIGVRKEDQSIYSFNFSDFLHIPTKTDYTLISIANVPDAYNVYDRIVMLWFEHPNTFALSQLIDSRIYNPQIDAVIKQKDKFIKLFINCPFSTEWLNRNYFHGKCEWAYFPFNMKNLPAQEPKIYDVFYAGGLLDCPINHAFPIMQKFNHVIVSFNGGTHRGVSYKEKLKLNTQSKITITHSLLLWPDRYKHIIPMYPEFQAFETALVDGKVPQMKMRIFEAALSKSIILTLHDKWNMIECYLEPDKDFLYWYDEKDLEEKIKHILTHYDDYKPMIEHAYNTVVNNYTTKHFFEKYLKDL